MNAIPQSIWQAAIVVAVGLTLLFLGRRLFWLFVGVVGFLVGWHIGLSFFSASPMPLVLAGCLGVAMALLSIVFEKVLIVLAGAAAGGLLCMRLADGLGGGEQLSMMLAVGGAVVFAIIALTVFDAGLAVISSLIGAALVLDPFPLAGMIWVIVFAIVASVGIASQLRVSAPD